MPPGDSSGVQPGYPVQVATVIGQSLARLMRSPSHSRHAEARRRLSRRSLWLTAAVAVVIAGLMLAIDMPAIRLMPPRGTAGLWPVKFVSDFGKSAYVLWALLAVLLATALAIPRFRGRPRGILIRFGTQVQYIFLAVGVSVLVGDVLKGVIGRGRPFVGGEANPFNYSHFVWTEAYASFPSGHAMTAVALAFAVSSLWPRLRWIMIVYAVVILLTRLVLLAHHPSDVIGGALVGLLGAMFVRQWFAARRLAFAIRADGAVVPRGSTSPGDLKRVARAAFAPYETGAAGRH
jgi:undecaprenyl-diphosphatase